MTNEEQNAAEIAKLEDFKKNFATLSNSFASLKQDFDIKTKNLSESIDKSVPTDSNNEGQKRTMKELNDLCNSMASMIDNHSQKMKSMADYMYGDSDYSLSSRINKTSDKLYSHANSAKHVPELTPTQMNKLLSVCGTDGDKVIVPQQIYASNNPSKGKTLFV